MTKRKTAKYKKKVQKGLKKQYKPMPKYKIVTTTEYPLIRKTEYATTINGAVVKAKRNAIRIIIQTNIRSGKYITKSHSQIYYYTPRLHKYKKLVNHHYKGSTYVKKMWGKDYYRVKRI